MFVYFVRHASAGQSKASREQDEKRALDTDGVKQARHIGRVLAALEVEVDAIISSPLKRAMQTAALIAAAIGHEAGVERDPALRPEASFSAFRDLLNRNDRNHTIMVVGHNPSITEFLSLLLSRGSQRELLDFKKGAVAKVEMRGNRAAILDWCITPKLAQAASQASSTSG